VADLYPTILSDVDPVRKIRLTASDFIRLLISFIYLFIAIIHHGVREKFKCAVRRLKNVQIRVLVKVKETYAYLWPYIQ